MQLRLQGLRVCTSLHGLRNFISKNFGSGVKSLLLTGLRSSSVVDRFQTSDWFFHPSSSGCALRFCISIHYSESMGYHGWFHTGLATVMLLIVFGAQGEGATDNLRVVYEWNMVDYNWPNETTKQQFPHYKRENNVPLGLEVSSDRVFITIPRFRDGVIATLNYFNLNDTSTSPLLNPYPSWEAHKYGEGSVPEVISVCRIRADRCGRLWVVDTGRDDFLGNAKQQAPPTLIVYDLSNDQVLRKHVIPGVNVEASFLTNVAVEDASCEDTFAYLADSRSSTMMVYSWRLNESWPVHHHYFYPDPLGGNFNVSGVPVQWWDGITGMALAPKPDGFSTLYFNSISSTYQFSVDTEVLRDRELASQSLSSAFHRFKVLGSRGYNGQGISSFLDPTSGILFHVIPLRNSVSCWKTGTEYTFENQGIVHENNVTVAIMPSDIKIDLQGNIYVLSDQIATQLFGQMDPDEGSFRILTAPVHEAVRGTPCAQEKPESSGLNLSMTGYKMKIRH